MSILRLALSPSLALRDSSEDFGYDPEGIVSFLVVAAVLSFRQLDLRPRQLLVWDPAQEVGENVQPRPPLVVGVDNIPRRPRGVGGEEHLVAGPRVIVPTGIRFEVHVGQLPDFAA